MNKHMIELIEAEKNIKGKMILTNINLKLDEGEWAAIIGHNGSGKSTLLKLMAGFFEPTAGSVKRRTKKIGFVPEHFPDQNRFRMREFLLSAGRMGGRTKSELEEEIEYYAELFNAEGFLETPLKNCSKGTMQKAGIIQALLLQPDVLLLDEPLTGLDEEAQQAFLRYLPGLKGKMAIAFTAHENFLVREAADRVIELENGSVVSDVNNVAEAVKYIKALVPHISILKELPAVQYSQLDHNLFIIKEAASASDVLLKSLLDSGCSIVEVIERGGAL